MIQLFLFLLKCALVRPILEYDSVVWNPHCAYVGRQFEREEHFFALQVTF